MINKTILVGRVGKDPETKQITEKASVTSFSLVTTERIKKGKNWEEEATWHNIKAINIGKLADWIKKGKMIYLEGKIKNGSYTNKEGIKVYFSEVEAKVINPFISGDGNNQAATNESPQTPVDEELPF